MPVKSPLQCCAPIARPRLRDDQARSLEQVFKALADQLRVKMVNLLAGAVEAEVCVCDIEEAFDISQSLASYHLKQLVDAGLVKRERRGTYSFYRLVPGALEEVGALLQVPRSARIAA